MYSLRSVCAQTHSSPLPWCTLSHGADPAGTVLGLFHRLGHRSQAWGTLTRGWRGRGKEMRVLLLLPPRAAFTVVAAAPLWPQLSADTPAADPAPWAPASSPLVFVSSLAMVVSSLCGEGLSCFTVLWRTDSSVTCVTSSLHRLPSSLST